MAAGGRDSVAVLQAEHENQSLCRPRQALGAVRPKPPFTLIFFEFLGCSWFMFHASRYLVAPGVRRRPAEVGEPRHRACAIAVRFWLLYLPHAGLQSADRADAWRSKLERHAFRAD